MKVHNTICNIVDEPNKKQHYITTTKKLGLKGLVEVFVKHVWKYHGFPRSIISHYGGQFIRNFWKFSFKKLWITAQLSIVWYSEIDGQTKKINSVIKQYFGAYINNLLENWFDWLAMAEFVSNNIEFEITKLTLLFSDKEFDPCIRFELIKFVNTAANNLNVNIFANQMEEIQKIVQSHMLLLYADHEKYTDSHQATGSI